MGMVLSPDRIREARKQADLSLREAARRIPASKTSLVNAEAGVTVPGGDLLGRMASTFGVPVDFFFTHAAEAPTPSTRRGLANAKGAPSRGSEDGGAPTHGG